MTVSFFDALGAEPGLRAITDAFYRRMESHAPYARLRSLHPQDLEGSRDKLYWFLCGWLGGPNHYMERYGHPRLKMRHLPFAIGTEERDQWLACMADALQECRVEAAQQAQLLQALTGTADWMRNQPG